MSRFIPYPAYYYDAPVDISFVYESEKPAGKHGFLKACGDHFEFEDGTPGRFWGTNFNGGACFPDFEHSENIAKRLAKIGCNIVRFHQLDAEWDTPNIFRYTKGPRCDKTTEFDKESMKYLDYLISCLKKNGIYVYLDIFTYRKFKSGDGVENAIELSDAAKPYSGYNRKLIELQKKLAYDIWNHFNPYTNLAYKDDPVFVMGEVVNESDLFSRPITLEPYTSEFRGLFRKWLDENKIEFDAENCDVNNNTGAVREFKTYLQEEYYKEMIGFMKRIGVKIPLCGSNWTINDANIKAQLAGDFTDSHTYYYDWRWGEHRCMNRAITQTEDCGFDGLSRMRVYDKPFFVSEWDMPWPNAYRAESPLLYAAVGALQNWAGFAIHTYAYSNRLERMNMLGKELSNGSIGGVAYREGIFSTWNDPAKFGLFYHAALITRRADVTPANLKIAIKAGQDMTAAYHASSEQNRIASQFDDTCLADKLVDAGVPQVDLSKGEVLSDNGQMYRSWKDNYGYINTERTKCFYGFLAKNGEKSIDGLTVKCDTDFAVIAMSSLTDEPISQTKNILLTTVGRAENTDAKFDGDLMLEYGKPPILAEVIEAEIALENVNSDMRVWAVDAEGTYIGAVPSSYENGVLKFRLGDKFASVFYVIQAE